MNYVMIVAGVLAAVLLYLLSHASANNQLAVSYYRELLIANIVLAVLLVGLIARQVFGLYRQVREHQMGSRFTRRLLVILALMAVLPSSVVYIASVNFLTHSIESWFNVRVEAALDGGVRLGQTAADILLDDMGEKAKSIAGVLALQPPENYLSTLTTLREQNAIRDVVLLNMQGKILAFSSVDHTNFLPNLPSADQIHRARSGIYGVIDPIHNQGVYLRVLVPLYSSKLKDGDLMLQLLQPLPKSLETTAESVQEVFREYRELSVSRDQLKQVFAVTLTLVVTLAMLFAVAYAFVLSRRLSAPLGVLAEGTQAIARGEYSQVLPAHGKDELGVLVQSFNSMTQQLREAKEVAMRHQAQVESAREYLDKILEHLSSGVITFDRQLQLRTANTPATQILGFEFATLIGEPLVRCADIPVLKGLMEMIERHFCTLEAHEWQEQLAVGEGARKQLLLVTGTRFKSEIDGGFVVVFDDVTSLLQAQRESAWSEVARRLAHEIKNPLTPIMLAAERLEHKLADKLDGSGLEILRNSTRTIVTQVVDMKSMVDEFSAYAHQSTINIAPFDMVRLVSEVLVLYGSDSAHLETEEGITSAYVQGDILTMRRLLHNLLKNAQEASDEQKPAKIVVRIALEGKMVKVSVSDNGHGVPENLIERVFEPYVTSKQQGTGLGLAMVKKIVEEHLGTIQIENQSGGGACVSFWVPLWESK